MNKLVTKATIGLSCTLALAVVAVAGVGEGAAAAPSHVAATGTTTSTTLGPPAQGPRPHKLFLHVDTVAGGSYKPVSDCEMTNFFQPGQTVVFRMDGIQVATGGIDLTNQNVLNAFVMIPGEKNLQMKYGTHEKDSYWTAAWTIPMSYPLGVVNFSVWVTTKAVPATATSPAVPEQTGIFSQNGFPTPSRLTVVNA